MGFKSFFSVSFIYKRFVNKIKSIISSIIFGRKKKDRSKKKEKKEKGSGSSFGAKFGLGKKKEEPMMAAPLVSEKGLIGNKGYAQIGEFSNEPVQEKKKKRNPMHKFKKMF
ncbi:hypothetical protein H072_4267 [Dactylellina haptotyla CBS 200.50]|uniref:Uncharacterized protein n=1 Tax=Dactylellina haptotyla (strain CBS 200.50) TaxID=1284197 RepID=S8AFC2_DACHA|nr:hypothetical protein H072_4267 [Dactylellina haptotyla CBS 200.50]